MIVNYSINITGDWRAIYMPINNNEVLFIAFGTHSQLYK
jgi:mRNA-degrading endonuclease YafQ of YafQ-DinJ toxin-antitoxin module